MVIFQHTKLRKKRVLTKFKVKENKIFYQSKTNPEWLRMEFKPHYTGLSFFFLNFGRGKTLNISITT